MFDVGFQEVVLIGLIGLIVVGPQRLPGLARTIGVYVNKMRRFVTDVRADVEKELHAEELRESFKSSVGLDEFEEVKDLIGSAKDEFRKATESVDAARTELNEATDSLAEDAGKDDNDAADLDAYDAASDEENESGVETETLPTSVDGTLEDAARPAVPESSGSDAEVANDDDGDDSATALNPAVSGAAAPDSEQKT